MALARQLRDGKTNDLVRAARQYAGDARHAAGGATMFGNPPEPASSFADAFGRTETREQLLQQQQTGAEEQGPHGPILSHLTGNPEGAVAELLRRQTGEVPGALSHPEIQEPIDLVWGKTDAQTKGKGFGLSHIINDRTGDTADHAEGNAIASNLQSLLNRMKVTDRRPERLVLESADHRAGLALNWNGARKNWLVTAFKK